MNIARLLEETARSFPDRPALEHGDTRWTYAELVDRVRRVAGAYSAAGAKAGDRVLLAQANGTALLESLLGCFYGGFVAVPANARLVPREVGELAEDSSPAVVVHDAGHDEHAAACRNGARTPVALRIDGAADGALHYEEALAAAVPYEAPAEAAPDDPAWIFFTSGTTGRQKGATLSHRNLLGMTLRFLSEVSSLGPDDVVLHAAPLTHGSGIYAIPPIARGACQVITTSRSYDPAEVLGLIEKRGVGYIAFLAPTMVRRLVEVQRQAGADIGALRGIVYGGAPMYLDDIKDAVTVLGPVLTQIYGQAEAPVTISYLSREDHQRALAAGDDEALMSAGRLYTGIEARVVDENGDDVPPGTTGEIITRSDVVMAAYWRNPEATESTIRNGWLWTGDIGRLDERGVLTLLDRSKDVIISGGTNVYPREVEEALLLHPAVAEVSVFGAPDREWGERVVAVVVAAAGVDADAVTDDVVAHCRTLLAGYKLPRQIEWVDELPKSHYGKILKRELRDRYWQGHDRRI